MKSSSVLALVNRIETIAEKVNDIIKELFGNGKPGIKNDLADLKNDVIKLKTQMSLGIFLLSAIFIGVIAPLILKYAFHIGG